MYFGHAAVPLKFRKIYFLIKIKTYTCIICIIFGDLQEGKPADWRFSRSETPNWPNWNLGTNQDQVQLCCINWS